MAHPKKSLPQISIIVSVGGKAGADEPRVRPRAAGAPDVEVVYLVRRGCPVPPQAIRRRLKTDGIVWEKDAGNVFAAALAKARGDYVAFRDADQAADMDMLLAMRNRAQATGAQIVTCAAKDARAAMILPADADVLDQSAFHFSDMPLSFFQALGRDLTHKLFDRAFLQQVARAAPRTPLPDVYLALAAGIGAQKISDLPLPPAHPAPQDARPDRTPAAIRKTYLAVRTLMRDTGADGLLQQSFLNEILDVFFESADRLPEPLKSFHLAELRSEIISGFGLDDWGQAFYRPHLWERMHAVRADEKSFKRLRSFSKKKPDRVVPIAFATNAAYAPFACVAIQSVIDNGAKDFYYDIYVLHTALDQRLIDILEGMSGPNVRIRCANAAPWLPAHVPLHTKGYYSAEMYYRWLIPEMLAYDKALYLDCDVAALDDVARLYRQDIGEAYVAGAKNYANPAFQAHIKNKLRLDPLTYVNTGVLLINSRLWRQEDIARQCFDMAQQKEKLNCPDQDALNLACRNHIRLIDPAWNCLWQPMIAAQHQTPAFSPPELDDWHEHAFKHPKIIHYNTHIKPWREAADDLADVWWGYARKSPLYEKIIEDAARQIAKARRHEPAVPEGIEGMRTFNRLIFEYAKAGLLAKLPLGAARATYRQEQAKIKKQIEAQYQKVAPGRHPRKKA
ncbi:MAG: glycosyltransferase family 8 protein [Alphaproteobacteria bacterium]|nr:glycosyltransferase family 8 protein [Alphaproteobacteria bacterium]